MTSFPLPDGDSSEQRRASGQSSVRQRPRQPGMAAASSDGRRSPPYRVVHEAVSRLNEPSVTFLWVVVAAGILLRVVRYLDNRSLWLDESFLAINVIDKSFSDLSGRLEFLQSAPVGFLLAEKAVVSAFGDSEYALRLLPLLSSVAALVLFGHIARRLLPPAAALLALILFATNSVLLYQSSELKPYSSDVAVALVLVALALHAGGTSEALRLRRLVPLALVAPVAVWFSFPAILVLGAISGSLAVAALTARDRRRIAVVAALSATWLASFAVLYAVASENVTRITEAILGGGGEHVSGRVTGVVQGLWSTFVNPGGFENGTNGLAVMLFAVGVIVLARRLDLTLLALLGLPLVFAALAALLDKYPLGGRFSTFLVPFLVLLVAAGAAAAVKASRNPVLAASLLLIFLAAAPVGLAAWQIVDPPRREHIKPLLRQLIREWQPGDTLYVYRNSQYALRYYGTCQSCAPSGENFPWPTRTAPASPTGEQFAPALEANPPTLVIGEQDGDPTDSADEADALPAGRVWLLFSHPPRRGSLTEESLFRAALDRRGRLLDQTLEDSASLYLYQLRGSTAS